MSGEAKCLRTGTVRPCALCNPREQERCFQGRNHPTEEALVDSLDAVLRAARAVQEEHTEECACSLCDHVETLRRFLEDFLRPAIESELVPFRDRRTLARALAFAPELESEPEPPTIPFVVMASSTGRRSCT